MQALMFFMGVGTLVVGLCYSLKTSSAHDIQQAALLPFADDPEAANKITQSTGMTFDKIVNGIELDLTAVPNDSTDSFVA
ncbi:MAG: hypothetical protein KGL60_21105 [Pseudomonas sp.]|jgi:hypothetical protein|uniref:hypothetical protein n=1 Tax=Pseudomonas sp. TaxID=306 RepID=UPI00238C9151|nr:hypothetical protein [Pseudomonas sp.]MDP9058491.1 hypothetical protein [Pseudomonadota bacterium]MDE1910338.1 hypothetical protein [Pseudomonas sp.]MDE2037523.1 hypothetical protein [Pseudomonas sp.]MDE2193422.1 hypothetical protein [Pseudomonas sp.]MDE2558320.1 hypothetical protein [Pseudomonas sp.]